ncbi:MAG TPA: prepilin-type N-terminal cleavage/methylation domain-containing protein [Candidatus Binatia bacterium]
MTLPAGNNNRGFSLFELILVLVLLGVSMAIVLPNIEKGLQDREVRSSALGLAAAARDLRSKALFDGVAQQLVVNLPQNSYLAAHATEVRLPPEVRFVSVGGGETISRDLKRFYFFPNGSSLGGEIVIADSVRSASYLIRMEALTGRVEVARAD